MTCGACQESIETEYYDVNASVVCNRCRRAIEAASASLDASVEDYDGVLVTLLGDVATNYVQLRTFERRIEYARANVRVQRETLRIAEGRFKAGTTGEPDNNGNPHGARSRRGGVRQSQLPCSGPIL